MKLVAALTFGAVALAAGQAQTPVRDQVRPTSTGSATVSGAVVVDDETRAPLRRASVTLSRTGIEDMRTTSTDDQGRFIFTALPAGTFTLTAWKGAYVSMNYGAAKPGMPGISIVLTDGQTFTARPIALMRGAVIAGRLTDRSGRPFADASVQAVQFVVVNGERRRRVTGGSIPGSSTNAHGDYRIYGLLPGEYLVYANTSLLPIQGEATAAELTWIQRPVGAAPKSSRSFTFASTMFPGTADASAGVPITLTRGEERAGVDFSMQFVPVARVTGTVTGPDGRPVPNVNIFCTLKQTQMMSSGTPTARTTPDGTFAFAGLAPGEYVLSARGLPTVGAPLDPMARVGLAPAPSLFWGLVDLSVSGQDVSDVAIRLQPGMSVSGQIAFKGSPSTPSVEMSKVQVRLLPVSATTPIANLAAAVSADGSFQFDGVIPGSYRVTATTPAPVAGATSAWWLRSAMLGGVDRVDVAFEVAPNQNLSGLTVTFVDRPGELAGALTDGAGRPAPQLYVFLFPADKTLWTSASRRVRAVRSVEDGSYAIAGVPPGEYYVCALTEIETTVQFEPSYLQDLVPAAIKVTLGEGEKKRQDLRIGG